MNQPTIGVWDADEPKKTKTMQTEQINKQIQDSGVDTNLVSDGYHTFGELYEARKCLNAALFNEWALHMWDFSVVPGVISNSRKHDVHKSWRHHDGELCFGGGWFIVVAVLPTGQISYHYEAKDWDLFRIPEVATAKYEWDGHTGQDVIERLKQL